MEAEERRPILPLIFAALLLAALLWLITFLREEAVNLGSQGFSANYLGFLFLINGNIILVMVLGFLVVKNVVKLVLDRNKGLLGSRLRARLVVAFVGLALVPTILLFLISRGIVTSVFQYWFSPQVTASVDGALAIAKYQYDSLEKNALNRTENFANRLSGLLPVLVDARGAAGGQEELNADVKEGRRLLRKYLEEKSHELNFAESTVFRSDGEELASYRDSALLRPGAHLNPNLATFQTAVSGQSSVRPERSRFGELVRAYVPVKVDGTVRYVLLTSIAETGKLGQLLSQVLDAYEDYRELRTYRIPLTSTYILTLIVVSLLILFTAIWVGFFLARTISGPIQLLAEGTQEIAKGNLSHRIPDVGRDELRMLVDSFNRMTEDLSRTTGELEERRRYMETVLESVGVGVLSLDVEGKIATSNRAAMAILGLKASPVGKTLESLGVAPLTKAVSDLSGASKTDVLNSENISLSQGGRTRYLQITVTSLEWTEVGKRGTVILVDDFTELVRAQRTAAWQEVARRMAHEIKNPLTPIQLSAQRLERRLSSSTHLSSEENALVKESAETITRSVETLRTLVNEFSRFARLPKANLGEMDLPEVIKYVLENFRESYPSVDFQLVAPVALPKISGDREQMVAVLTNIYENAVQSIERVECSSLSSKVVTTLKEDRGKLSVSIADNGIGVPEEDKPKLFEPYFSTRKGGTGLGLAIVSAILDDHGGRISVSDNTPRGAVFAFELPLKE